MAKRMRKMMAMLMALSLCFSTIVLPAVADEIVPEPPADSGTTVTVEITDSIGTPIGEKVTTTTTTSDSSSTTTNTQSNWNTQQTQDSSQEPVTNGNTTVTQTNTVITDVTGSENSTDKVEDLGNGVQNYSGTTTGSETTTITDTTTTTTTTTNALQSDVTGETQTTIDNKIEEGSWSDLQKTDDGQWQSTGTTGDGYVQDGEKTTTNNGTTSVDVDNDPLKNTDVTLQMDAPTGDSTESTDSKQLFIAIEDALANDITYTDGQKLEDGSVVKYQYDANNNVIGYTITKITPTGSTNNNTPTPGTSGEPVKAGGEVKTYVKPEGYTPCVDAPIVDENGKTIGTRTVEEILDENKNVIGYTITEKVITTPGNLPNKSTEELDVPEPVRTLPERPVAPAPVTKDGLTTTVTVEDIVENGETVGYKTTKTVTDENGNEVSTESESIYGTVTSYKSTLTKTPERDEVTTTTVTTVYGTLTTQNYTVTTPGTTVNTSTRDVTNEIYELVETKDGLYFLFEGKMYQVQAITSTNPDDISHGTMNVTSVSPQLNLTPSGDGSISESTDLRNPHYNNYVDVTYGEGYSVDVGDGYDYKYVGYGLESSITARTTNPNGTLVHQFKLQDEDGNFHYVLCADFNTTAYRDADYNMQNVMDATYYSSDNARHIQAIVTNGYWGTSSGVGSLDAVKNFLKEKSDLDDALIDNMTHGEALTATQAAIWYYGHSSNSPVLNNTNAAKKQYDGSYYWDNGSRVWNYKDLSDSEIARVDALYQALINLDPNTVADGSTELLNTNNFATETQLIVKEKATTETGNVKTDAAGNEKYITDLTFSLDVKKSDLTGNLVVTVSDENGNVIRTEQIATDSSNLVGKLLADGTTSTTEQSYTIRNLEVAEGVKINLNLSGTQNIAQGAYLYSAEVYSDSQTFVGLGYGSQEVNLNVQMEFTVTDPEAKVKHTTQKWSEKSVEKESYTKTDNYKKEKLGTQTNQTVTVNTKVFGTNVQQDVTQQETVQHRQWKNSYFYSIMTIWDEDGGGGGGDNGGKQGKNILIDDEEVPLAAAPKTGDITTVLAAMSLFSAGGLVVLNRKREDEE